MADISKIKLPDGTTYNVKDANALHNADLSTKANLTGGNSFTGNQNFNNNASITSYGYVTGTWLQTTATTNTSSYTDIFVNSGGWLYKRSLNNFKSDLGIPKVYLHKLTITDANQQQTMYISTFSTSSTAITKTTAYQYLGAGMSGTSSGGWGYPSVVIITSVNSTKIVTNRIISTQASGTTVSYNSAVTFTWGQSYVNVSDTVTEV